MSLQRLDNMLVKGEIPKDIPLEIRSSWERSLKAGVQPTLKKTPFVSSKKEIDHIISSNMLYRMFTKTKIRMEKYLDRNKHSLTLADNQGRIIGNDVQGKLADQLMNIHFYPGGHWREDIVGTNAVGTALVTGQGVTIRGTHHFCEGWQAFSCAGVPIKHPFLNKIAGVLDLTTWREQFPDQALSLTGAIVQSIELEWQSYILQTHQKILRDYSEYERIIKEDIIFAIDCSGVIVSENEQANMWKKSRKIDGETIASVCNLLSLCHVYEGEITFGANYQGTGKIIPVIENAHPIGFIIHLVNEKKEKQKQRVQIQKSSAFSSLIGECSNWLKMIEKAQKVAVQDTSVLLTGESGTGKELLARAIHKESARKNSPFIAINCATLTHELSASELFGYASGAFTGALKSGKSGAFEEADGGTLFLDEVSEMPLSMQAMFLRVLQEQEVVRIGEHRPRAVNVRIIAATNRDLLSWINKGKFRQDLYYRLNVVNIPLPSLRERKEDIPYLAEHFLRKLSEKLSGDKPVPYLDPRTKQILIQYHWPGNSRELKNVMEYVLTFTHHSVILPADLPENIFPAANKLDSDSCEVVNQECQQSYPSGDREVSCIINALEEQRYNMTKAARQLGISRSTLYRKLKRYKINI